MDDVVIYLFDKYWLSTHYASTIGSLLLRSSLLYFRVPGVSPIPTAIFYFFVIKTAMKKKGFQKNT